MFRHPGIQKQEETMQNQDGKQGSPLQGPVRVTAKTEHHRMWQGCLRSRGLLLDSRGPSWMLWEGCPEGRPTSVSLGPMTGPLWSNYTPWPSRLMPDPGHALNHSPSLMSQIGAALWPSQRDVPTLGSALSTFWNWAPLRRELRAHHEGSTLGPPHVDVRDQ